MIVTEPYQIMPALASDTEAALRSSIERFGVLVPIVVDIDGNIIDGHHRLRIAREQEPVKAYPLIVIMPVSSAENIPTAEAVRARDQEVDKVRRRARDIASQFEAYDLDVRYVEVEPGTPMEDIARTLNLDRRHLEPDQRREVVCSLRQDGHSLRSIAGAVGVSKSQVEKDIKQVSTGGHLTLVPESITGKDGKSYPSTKSTEPPTPADTPPRTWDEIVALINADASKGGRKNYPAEHQIRRMVLYITENTTISSLTPDMKNADPRDRPALAVELRRARTVLSQMISTLEASS